MLRSVIKEGVQILLEPVAEKAQALHVALGRLETRALDILERFEALSATGYVTIEGLTLRDAEPKRFAWSKRAPAEGAVDFIPQMTVRITAIRASGWVQLEGARVSNREIGVGYPFEGCALLEVDETSDVGSIVRVFVGPVGRQAK